MRSLALAQQLNDHRSQAKVLWNSMLIEILDRVDYHKALEFGEQSLRIARQYGLDEQIAYILHDSGRAHLAVDQFAEAREALEGAREFWRATGNKPMLADNLNISAGNLYAQGAFTGGTELVEESLDICRSIGSVHLEAAAIVVIAQAHAERGDIGLALTAIDEGIGKFDAGPALVSAHLRGTGAAIYGLIGMADRAIEEALIAIELSAPRQAWLFRISLALAYLGSGRLLEAEEALQPSYEDPQMLSKRNTDYHGMICVLPDVIRGELALARQDYNLVLSYNLTSHERAAEGGKSVLLPELIRIKAQALLGLGRVGEAGESLAAARVMAEAQGSRRTLWPIFFEMSRVASLEGNHQESERLLEESRDTINYIAEHCGAPEIRQSFLDLSTVRRALGAE